MPMTDEQYAQEQAARQVASHMQYGRDHWYGARFVQCMRDWAPFDVETGGNTLFLIKHLHGGWGFRRDSWSGGPRFVPAWDAEPQPLEAVLDRIHRHSGPECDQVSPQWLAWKAEHPEVFPVPAGARQAESHNTT